MEISKFQFTNPVLKHLRFDVNNEFVKSGKMEMEIKLNVNCNRKALDVQTTNNSAVVEVTIVIGANDNSTPFYIEATEEASFMWNESIVDQKKIDNLLNQNAVALLISYLRPIITNITAASQYPAYNIPYINLTATE